MKYNMLVISDIHWGAVEAKTLYSNLSIVLDTIREMKNNLDMVVICGDYFDYKLTLNSKSALFALQWMDELVNCCKENNIKKIRVVKGTHEHDNNQLEAFRVYEDDDSYYKIFTENTIEETLPNMKCMYCPDELIATDEYMKKYMKNIMSIPDIGFFHGSFDIVLPDIVVQHSNESHNRNVIFSYGTFSSLIKGPMIAGHWHTMYFENPLLYTGSFDRWVFGEEEPKGFIILQYDTDSHEYSYIQIENTKAKRYDTIIVDTSNITTTADYAELISNIEEKYDLENNRLRVKILKSTSTETDDDLINTFKKYFINNKNVKIEVKDLEKKKEKTKKKNQLVDLTNKYGFIFDPNISIAEKYQQWIYENKNKSIPIDNINKILSKYIGE